MLCYDMLGCYAKYNAMLNAMLNAKNNAMLNAMLELYPPHSRKNSKDRKNSRNSILSIRNLSEKYRKKGSSKPEAWLCSC